MSKKVIKTAEVSLMSKATVLPLTAHLVSRLTRAHMVLKDILNYYAHEEDVTEDVTDSDVDEDGNEVQIVTGFKVVGTKKVYDEVVLHSYLTERLDTVVLDLLNDIMHAIEEDDDDSKCK